MASIYVHVPFCASRCFYCDFYSAVRLEERTNYLLALHREIEIRKDYLGREPIKTIYLGGGTPSLLSIEALSDLFDALAQHFDLSALEEVTLEANPDDLTAEYLLRLISLPVNRLSLGIQSFRDDDLRLINRRHTAHEAIAAVERAQSLGLTNISIDLIYGLPSQTKQAWEANIEQALSLNVPHISAYHLTYEEGTVLHRQLQEGKICAISEDDSLEFFRLLRQMLIEKGGYEHYEISNFSRPQMHSRHNSAYWNDTHYLGLGPSAHSYDGKTRSWNVASLANYLEGITTGKGIATIEKLSHTDRLNEMLMTRLRTAEGLSLARFRRTFGDSAADQLFRDAHPYLKRDLLLHDTMGERLHLSTEGIFLSDGIIADLMQL